MLKSLVIYKQWYSWVIWYKYFELFWEFFILTYAMSIMICNHIIVNEGSFPPPQLLKHLLWIVLIIILTEVRWYLKVICAYMSLITRENDLFGIQTLSFLFVCSFIFCFLYCFVLSYLYMLDNNSLSQSWWRLFPILWALSSPGWYL